MKNKFLRAMANIFRDHYSDRASQDQAAELIATAIPTFLRSQNFPDYFRRWERAGFHVTPDHFYSPVPSVQALRSGTWEHSSELVGVNMNAQGQLRMLQEIFPKFSDEYLQFPMTATGNPTEFYLTNGSFEGVDALVLYCMVRHFRANRVIECGSGHSTLVTALAALRNGNTNLTCIEPFPSSLLKKKIPGLGTLIQSKVEELPLKLFEELSKDDILFIDTSHVVRTGGDVTFLFLEVIPRLASGVVIHVHDIFFPWEYPKDWIFKELRFWTEQYLLQAFLTFNNQFEVLFANYFMEHYHRTALLSVFPNAACVGSSFWMRRI